HLEEQPGGSLPESVRVSALEAARDLVASLEKPQDALIRFAQSRCEPAFNWGSFLRLPRKGLSCRYRQENEGGGTIAQYGISSFWSTNLSEQVSQGLNSRQDDCYAL
ncbi:hypothetical protein PG985_014361, partial [Apiospora marii]|uniref:uncharacterized protein n=1 Tax=Apiospora marii TaxID=335849 RepID=UPI003131137B